VQDDFASDEVEVGMECLIWLVELYSDRHRRVFLDKLSSSLSDEERIGRCSSIGKRPQWVRLEIPM